MFKSDIHELLCLFAAAVIIDKPIITGQAEIFTQAAIEFSQATNLAPSVNRPRLQMWFAINRDNIISKHKDDDFETWLENLMARVVKIYPSQAVLAAIQNMSRSVDKKSGTKKPLSKLVDKYRAQAA